MENKITIGELAEMVGVNIQTIHYYERRGLLAPVSRSASGYRLYTDKEGDILNFIRQSKELGLTLKEIKELINLNLTSPSTCAKVRKKAEDKLMTIEQKMESLQQLQKFLKKLIEACREKRPAEECPILKFIKKGGGDAKKNIRK